MKIMVFDVAADSGGALMILKQYYNKAINDKENEWIFIVSKPNLKSCKNVKIISFPWVKRSWLHRFWFDRVISPKLIKKYKVDEVLSLQNLIIPKVDVKQILYLHQSLPFANKKYKIFENFKFWVYQNVISKMIYRSLIEADKIIVQTKWIRDACIKKLNVDVNKFELKPPIINLKVKKSYSCNSAKKTFFYTASGLEYKNHRIIVEAVLKLKREKNNLNFEVIFTLEGNESRKIRKLYNIVQKERLPIKFVGYIDVEKVYEYYSKSILIFPSYIETFGLPLLEARMHNSPIIASDMPFSHEILEDYDNKVFFDPFKSIELKRCINEILKKGINK